MPDYERKLPPLATLVAFEAAVRHQNFSHAAEELFQSQATVSRRIRELEADLGVTLFERLRHSVRPTAQAEELVASVRLSLAELCSAAERLRHQADSRSTFTILSSLSLASVSVAPVLGGFQERYPERNVRVLSACEPIETTHEEFDVALQYGASTSERFMVEFIAEEAVFPVCSPELLHTLPTPLSAQDWASVTLLDVEYDDPGWPTWDTVWDREGWPRSTQDAATVFSSYEVCLEVAERSDGVALGWERSVAPRIKAGSLVQVPGLVIPAAAQINAYISPTSAGTAEASTLVAMLRRVLTDS